MFDSEFLNELTVVGVLFVALCLYIYLVFSDNGGRK